TQFWFDKEFQTLPACCQWSMTRRLAVLGPLASYAIAQAPDLRPKAGVPFTGTNIEPIIAVVNHAFPPQTEFETDQQYLARTEMPKEGPLLAVVLDRDAGAEYSYIADH